MSPPIAHVRYCPWRTGTTFNTPAAGISRALALDRAARINDLRYSLHFTIPSDRGGAIHACATITFALADPSVPVVLDFAPNAAGGLSDCTANGHAVDPALQQGHIVIPSAALLAGTNAVRLVFAAGDAPLNRRADHLYTVFVPARAHEAFPCFDQPDLKARWTLSLEIPSRWVAVANADHIQGSAGAADREAGETRTVVFAETEPLPTYLFAFAAGPFLEHTAERNGRRLRIFHLAPDTESLAANHTAILNGHADALRWLETYTAIGYPFGKFDIVLLPAFQFTGMEHPGAIFYNSAAVLLAPSATRQQWLARANVVAHETAHMWFGDLVTMRWFDDVWMKEVFANFMADKIVNPQFPDLDHELRFLHTHYPAAYDVDRTAGANAVRQPLENLNDAGLLYGAIVYLKSPVVMRQLEKLVGEVALRDTLRAYLERFRFGNASWADLIALLHTRAPIDIETWSRDWIDEPGRPSVVTELVTEKGVVSRLALRTSDPIDERGLTWPQRVEVALGYGSRVEHTAVWLDGRSELPELRGTPTPDYVLPNGRGLGYGEWHLDPMSLEWLLRRLPEISDPLTRGSAWLTLWDAMLSGQIVPGALLELAMRALPLETSELNLQCILNYVERLFWTFQVPDERAARATSLERTLRTCIDTAAAATAKAALLASLRAIATTRATLDWLDALRRGDARVEALPLGEADRIAIARELAVKRSEDADRIIAQQLAMTINRDRREALAFMAPALSADPRERDRFFGMISKAECRVREPWVLEGMRWLHHPLRQGSSLKYLEPGLLLLAEVKRTGDIFLPKRWLDAMLGGHQTPAAADVVRAFLRSRPADYPAPLRRMALASADYLFRAADKVSGAADSSPRQR